MRFKIIVALLFFFLTISIQAKCHYSCKNCTQQFYSTCSSCPNNSNFTYVLALNPNSGTCAQVPIGQANAFGIILLVATICILPIFLEQQMVQLFLFLQTLGLYFLVQIYYIPILDYALSGCTYLMVISLMTYSYKTAEVGLNSNILKGRVFFGSFSYQSNIIVIGCINLAIFLILFLLPIFKNLRKKCVEQRVQFCPDWLIQKVQLAFTIAFIFLIQQTVSVIYFSLKYDQFSISGVVITIAYFIILIAFTINQFFYPLHIFRNKFLQTITIVGKVITPMFLLSSADQHFVLFPLVLTFSLITTIATNKNKNKGKFNRLLAYNILGIIVLCLFICLYIVEMLYNNAQTSQALGIICFVGILGVISCVIMELILKVKQKMCQNHLTQSKRQDKDNTMQTIEVFNQKQQKARTLSPSLYLQENRQEFNTKKQSSKDQSIVPQPSEHISPNIKRQMPLSNQRQIGQIDSNNKYQSINFQPSLTAKKEQQPLQQFEQIQYGIGLTTHTEFKSNQNIEQKEVQNQAQSSLVVSSRNTKRLSKFWKDKKSSK